MGEGKGEGNEKYAGKGGVYSIYRKLDADSNFNRQVRSILSLSFPPSLSSFSSLLVDVHLPHAKQFADLPRHPPRLPHRRVHILVRRGQACHR